MADTHGPTHQSSPAGSAARSARRVGTAITVSPSQFGRRMSARRIAPGEIGRFLTGRAPAVPVAPPDRRGRATPPATSSTPEIGSRCTRTAHSGQRRLAWPCDPRPRSGRPRDPVDPGARRPSRWSRADRLPPPWPAARPCRCRGSRTHGDRETRSAPGRALRARRACHGAVRARRSPRRRARPGPSAPPPDGAHPTRDPRARRPRSPRRDAAPIPPDGGPPRGHAFGSTPAAAPVRTTKCARASADGGSRSVPRGKRPPRPQGARASRQTISTSFRSRRCWNPSSRSTTSGRR